MFVVTDLHTIDDRDKILTSASRLQMEATSSVSRITEPTKLSGQLGKTALGTLGTLLRALYTFSLTCLSSSSSEIETFLF